MKQAEADQEGGAREQEPTPERRRRSTTHPCASKNRPVQTRWPLRVDEHPYLASPSTNSNSPDSSKHFSVTLSLGVLQASDLPGGRACMTVHERLPEQNLSPWLGFGAELDLDPSRRRKHILDARTRSRNSNLLEFPLHDTRSADRLGYGGRGSRALAAEPESRQFVLRIGQKRLQRTNLAFGSIGILGGFSAIYPVLESMEESSKVRRGYFVDGLGATEFALDGAVERLREARDASGDEAARLLAEMLARLVSHGGRRALLIHQIDGGSSEDSEL